MTPTPPLQRRRVLTGVASAPALILALSLTAWTPVPAIAAPPRQDAAESLRTFVREVQSARAAFTQTVTSPDGARKRTSSGRFEFQRPHRFRFDYAQPYSQVIVGDGRKVWLYDADLNQVTVRPMTQALGATPAALLAGGSVDRDFQLRALPRPQARDDLNWVEALPKLKDSQFQSLRIGFRGQTLATLEILDGFGQRSRLEFSNLEINPAFPAGHFEFKPPVGADVIEN